MVENVQYLGWPNCYRISNDKIELIVASEFGPRILHCSFIGQENTLGEYPDLSTRTALGEWKPWGGHRLWIAPERMPESYAPDNSAIRCEILSETSLGLRQPTDLAGFEKQMIVSIGPGSKVQLLHRITNRNSKPEKIAPWGITVMKAGGIALLPQEPFRSHDEHLLPARPLVLWHFTDLTDSRLTLGQRFIRVATDESKSAPQKIGAGNRRGWCAYYSSSNRVFFVKYFEYREGHTYPDFGANNEIYTAGSYIEIETLGPLQLLQSGESTEHVERWALQHQPELPADDAELERIMRSIVSDQRPS